ncbi:hypothetical protein UK23_21720 [Lentzea aerocolonigenes]|uniref:Peptidase inhibitor family I36 n=1 Tax=Lentzea aerocolonigenes TaxID=68170 RepID=A0A0F0GUM3_LENAE|nr:peptidase inhibitor family I36 protein [Lentzea aerocolonigenes]KJK46975.1 hypothetical protein UK23_21720 [Lentzea aerocolonigenes]
MKKLRVLLVALAAVLTSLVAISPAQAAQPCEQGQVCFYVDTNFGGFKSRYWDDQNKVNKKLRFSALPESRTVSSIRNLTPYSFNIWNSKGKRKCLPPSYKLAYLAEWDNDVQYIAFYTSQC